MQEKTLAILCCHAFTVPLYILWNQYISPPVHSVSSFSQKCPDVQPVSKISKKKKNISLRVLVFCALCRITLPNI